jgi:hypothetical protein
MPEMIILLQSFGIALGLEMLIGVEHGDDAPLYAAHLGRHDRDRNWRLVRTAIRRGRWRG